MRVLGMVLIVIGAMGVIDALIHLFSEHFYKKHPENERSYRFELLDVLYRHKYSRVLSITLGVVCCIQGVLLF